MSYYYNSNFKESIYDIKYCNFIESLKQFITDDKKLILYNENKIKLDSIKLLFLSINILNNTDKCIQNFIHKYNIDENKKNEIKNIFLNFINEFDILF